MKYLFMIALFLLITSVCYGQIDSVNTEYIEHSVVICPVLATDSNSIIFAFQMTSDTNKLKPIDTIYYTMHNEMYREVKYRYLLDNTPVFLIVRNYNDNHRWLFFGMQLVPYKKEK